MKKTLFAVLLLVCFFVFTSATATPAKADCPTWTYPVSWVFCGNFLVDGSYGCYTGVACENPDGTMAQYGDTWDMLGESYYQAYGSEPDPYDLENYYLWIC